MAHHGTILWQMQVTQANEHYKIITSDKHTSAHVVGYSANMHSVFSKIALTYPRYAELYFCLYTKSSTDISCACIVSSEYHTKNMQTENMQTWFCSPLQD